MKKVVGLLLFMALCALPVMAMADDCVEVDVEITPVSLEDESGLQYAEFSLELTNCGTEAALIGLTVELQTDAPQVVPPIEFHVPVGAGETIAKSWTFPVPPVVPPGTYEVCVTATSGDATDSDCASFTVEESSSTSSIDNNTQPMLAAGADDCVEVDIELTPVTIEDADVEFAELSLELTNCGPEAVLAALSFELDLGDLPFDVPPFTFYVPVDAGQTVAHSWQLPIPPVVPNGTYGLCVTATIGEASDSDCAEIEVSDESSTSASTGDDVVLRQNSPNPFNLGTEISFELNDATNVTLTVHNILGQTVATLANGHYSAGQHTVEWNATDNNGNVVATGMYLYRMTTDEGATSRKMLLIK